MTLQSPYTPTDLGNSKRLVNKMIGNVIYVADLADPWLWWNGLRWIPGGRVKLLELVEQVIHDIMVEGAYEWGKASQHKRAIEAMQSLASMSDKVSVATGALDANDWLLNVRNGILDLKTGTLHPHDWKQYMTKLVDVEYNTSAESASWHTFLDTVTEGDKELQRYLQKCCGYSLTGSNRDHALFILYGSGANGKTTFIEALRPIYGDYGLEMAPNSLMQSRRDGGSASPDIARLRGTRWVSTSEGASTAKLDEALVKRLTGGGVISARYLQRGIFEMPQTWKIWFQTNHRPDISGTDHAIWRRIKSIPFNARIPRHKQDPYMQEKLLREASYILSWAVEGCIAWAHEGLKEPSVVLDATRAYRSQYDQFGPFVDEVCIVSPNSTVGIRQLYDAYVKYCRDHAETYLPSSQVFGKALEDYFKGDVVRDKLDPNTRGWKGIGLKRRVSIKLGKSEDVAEEEQYIDNLIEEE